MPKDKSASPGTLSQEGTDFSELSEGTRKKLFDSVFGACNEWLVVTAPDQGKSLRDPGRRIFILRALRQWSQEQLAKKAGVSQAEVSRAEKDFKDVKFSTLERITRALGTTVTDCLSASDQ